MEKRLYGNYDELVVRCLPGYYLLLKIVIQAIGTPSKIIDLGVGTGNLARLIFQAIPNTFIEGVDTSSEFLATAKNKCQGYNFLPILANVLMFNLGQSERECIVSSFTIHHFEDSDKRLLFENIFQALKPGGIFIHCDMVKPKGSFHEALESFLANMKENGLSYDFIEAEREEMAERDRPVSLITQRQWLKQLGFRFELRRDIGLFAVYKCTKPFC